MPTVEALHWKCQECLRNCVTIRPECRCLCGHRWREHQQTQGRTTCTVSRCACRNFFYIVAEGAWVLHCACKHKHTDHEPKAPHKCVKCAAKGPGGCPAFASPWVCNCDHPWARHHHVWEQHEVRSPFDFEENVDPATVMRGVSAVNDGDMALAIPRQGKAGPHIPPAPLSAEPSSSPPPPPPGPPPPTAPAVPGSVGPRPPSGPAPCPGFEGKKFRGPLAQWCVHCHRNAAEH
eukprot:EG_transcript_22000